MYIRTVKSRDKEYVQLAHNFLDSKTGVSKAKILYNFGRRDQLDVEGLERFADRIIRFLDSENLVSLPHQVAVEVPFEFVGSRADAICTSGQQSSESFEQALYGALGERRSVCSRTP